MNITPEDIKYLEDKLNMPYKDIPKSLVTFWLDQKNKK